MGIAWERVGRRGGVYAARAIVWLPSHCRAGYTRPLRPHTEGAVQEPTHGDPAARGGNPRLVFHNSGISCGKMVWSFFAYFLCKESRNKGTLCLSTFLPGVFMTCSHSVYFGVVIHCVKGLSTLKMLKILWKEWKTTPVFRLKMWKTRWKALCRAVLVPKFSTGGLWRPGRGLTRPRYLCTIRIIQNCAKE